MPNRRLMDYMMRKDMRRNPYGVKGGYVSSQDPRMMRRGDRGMDERFYMDEARNRNDYAEHRGGQDYRGYSDGSYPMHDMGSQQYGQSGGSYGNDGHYPMSQGKTYFPIEAMGTFNGYWGKPQEDMRGKYMGYDPHQNYPMMDYRGRDMRYDMAGDYGEKLTKEELEKWRKKLEREVGDEQSKNFFRNENVEQRARQLGVEMKEFNAEELAIASYMIYSDYCKSLKPYVGQNMDVFIKMGSEFLTDPDSAVKGGEKLALYYEIVSEGGDD